MKLEFSRQIFEKNLIYEFPSESVQWEPSCFMRTDGRMDLKLIVAFRNFANAPEKFRTTQKITKIG